jgi:hypothetical protein
MNFHKNTRIKEKNLKMIKRIFNFLIKFLLFIYINAIESDSLITCNKYNISFKINIRF